MNSYIIHIIICMNLSMNIIPLAEQVEQCAHQNIRALMPYCYICVSSITQEHKTEANIASVTSFEGVDGVVNTDLQNAHENIPKQIWNNRRCITGEHIPKEERDLFLPL